MSTTTATRPGIYAVHYRLDSTGETASMGVFASSADAARADAETVLARYVAEGMLTDEPRTITRVSPTPL